MRLPNADCRGRLAASRHAYLATADQQAVPHLVPITCALDGDLIYTAIDDKPKSTTNLKRLRNIRQNPAVAVLADHYEDDWRRLWWLRVDGTAEILEDHNLPAWVRGAALLSAKYPQYGEAPPQGPVIRIVTRHWTGWTADPRLVSRSAGRRNHGWGPTRSQTPT